MLRNDVMGILALNEILANESKVMMTSELDVNDSIATIQIAVWTCREIDEEIRRVMLRRICEFEYDFHATFGGLLDECPPREQAIEEVMEEVIRHCDEHKMIAVDPDNDKIDPENKKLIDKILGQCDWGGHCKNVQAHEVTTGKAYHEGEQINVAPVRVCEEHLENAMACENASYVKSL